MSSIAKRWFDGFEDALEKEGELAGVLRHNTLIGSGREFFVKRVLRSILPPSVHVGAGQIVATNGVTSNQIDGVLYDPRFPLLEVDDGVVLYFVEGVIATIEVKSKLDGRELRIALDNCRSVMECPGQADTRDMTRRTLELKAEQRGHFESHEYWKRSLMPSTYIFAFESSLDYLSVAGLVDEWAEAARRPGTSYRPHLPRVIAAPRVIGLQNDGIYQLGPDDAGEGGDRRTGMGFWSTRRRFGWLAMHLMLLTGERLGLTLVRRVAHLEERLVSVRPQPAVEPVPLGGPADVLAVLAEQVNAVRADIGAHPVERARRLGFLAGVALRATEAKDLAARLEAVERVLKLRKDEQQQVLDQKRRR